MKREGLINEVFWLRCIACLAVTFGHAIQNGNITFTEPTFMHMGSYVMYMAVLFGVPVFVFISEFLLANKYLAKLPPSFLTKRLKTLLIPYIFMSVIYALFSLETWTVSNFIIRVSRNIFLGESSVYFILIIFQFYFLHMLFSKYLNRISPKIIIICAFIINFLYLGFFNFTTPPTNVFGSYFWNPGYWMPFIGWIFYFVLGFYCGKNYRFVIETLSKYKKFVLCMPIATLAIALIMNKLFLIDQSSKRVDMLLFACSMIFFIMYISSTFKKVPKLVMTISNYSFSIFLLNQLFFLLLLNIDPPAFLNIITYSTLAFLISLFGSIMTSYLFNQLSFGKYLVGKVMDFKLGSSEKGVNKSNLPKTKNESNNYLY